MNNEISPIHLLWVGVEFGLGAGADDSEHESEYIQSQNTAIDEETDSWRSASVPIEDERGVNVGELHLQLISHMGVGIDVRDDDGRVGFGITVNSIADGNKILPTVRDWLRSIGISMHVAVYEYKPLERPQRPPRPAGVDEMLSADII